MDDESFGRWPGDLLPVASRGAQAQLAAEPNPEAEREAFSALQARAARRGYRLERIGLDDGGPSFLVSSWGYTAELLSHDEVEGFLAGDEAASAAHERRAVQAEIRTDSNARCKQYRSPLAMAACTFGCAPLTECLACARWRRHAVTVRAIVEMRRS